MSETNELSPTTTTTVKKHQHRNDEANKDHVAAAMKMMPSPERRQQQHEEVAAAPHNKHSRVFAENDIQQQDSIITAQNLITQQKVNKTIRQYGIGSIQIEP
jgi:hypothetical protein